MPFPMTFRIFKAALFVSCCLIPISIFVFYLGNYEEKAFSEAKAENVQLLSVNRGGNYFSEIKPVNKRLSPEDDLKKEIELSVEGDHILLLPGVYSDFPTIHVPSGVIISGSKVEGGVIFEAKKT